MLEKLWTWCKRSETIVIARLHILAAAIFEVVIQIDPHAFTPFIAAKWIPLYLAVAGIVIEKARKYRDPDLGKQDHADDSEQRGA